MLYDKEDGKQIQTEDNVGQKILDSAVKIINQDGYDNLTIRKVAKESGCSNSAIYQRFEDKNALARAVAEIQSKPFIEIVDTMYSKDTDLLTNVNKITRKMLDMLYTFDIEAIYMQTLYRGGLKMEENPFILRIEECINTAMARGEVKVQNSRETAFLISASFWGFVHLIRANKNYDINIAAKLLEEQNRMLYDGIKVMRGEISLWDMLKEKGVDVDKALERMKGNKETYKIFLVEFFEDPDFESLGMEINAQNAKNAFEYAHGLKGMAANLGLDNIHNKLSVLVEILRPGGLEGAKEAYDELMDSCRVVSMLL